jgi:hypothetical protein
MQRIRVSTKNRPPPTTPPIRDSQINASSELIPPSANAADVQEDVTQENLIHIPRYLRWADRILKPTKARRRSAEGSLAGC